MTLDPADGAVPSDPRPLALDRDAERRREPFTAPRVPWYRAITVRVVATLGAIAAVSVAAGVAGLVALRAVRDREAHTMLTLSLRAHDLEALRLVRELPLAAPSERPALRAQLGAVRAGTERELGRLQDAARAARAGGADVDSIGALDRHWRAVVAPRLDALHVAALQDPAVAAGHADAALREFGAQSDQVAATLAARYERGIGRFALVVSLLVALAGLGLAGACWSAPMLLRRERAAAAAQAHRAQLAAIMDATADAILACDPAGVVRAANPAAHRLFGVERRLLGERLDAVLPGGDGAPADGALADLPSPGGVRRVEVRGFPLAGAGGTVAVLRDVTEREALALCVREKAALSRLAEMAGVVAHEVRNALAGVRTALQVLWSRPDGRPTGRASGGPGVTRADILDRLESLDGIVRDVLAYARPRPPERFRTSLRTAIESAWQWVPAADRGSSALAIDGEDVSIDVDVRQMRLALGHLLRNAVQAMRGAGTVCACMTAVNGHVRCVIADCGPGLAPEIQRRVFEPFVTSKTRGVGLGLAIARQVIEGHGGRIAIADGPAGGVAVAIEVPRVCDAALPPASGAA